MSEPIINSPLELRVTEIGNERTPVIRIDNLLSGIDGLIDAARRRGAFRYDPQWAYPGVRCPLPESYTTAVLSEIVPLIHEVYDVPDESSCQTAHALFSLLTTPAADLSLLQRIPHFDNHGLHYFATVHYLGPGHFGGTGFFRHRPTGFERITSARYPEYVAAAKAHMRAHGDPRPGYINASDDHFELIGQVDYEPNRIAIYPGNVLHSGLVEPSRDLGTDPASGRLTANLFLNFVEV